MWWKNYSIWLKTEQETIISNYIDFTKIAPTVPLCNGEESETTHHPDPIISISDLTLFIYKDTYFL